MDDCSTGAGNIQDETMRLKNSCHVRNKGSAQKKKKKKKPTKKPKPLKTPTSLKVVCQRDTGQLKEPTMDKNGTI